MAPSRNVQRYLRCKIEPSQATNQIQTVTEILNSLIFVIYFSLHAMPQPLACHLQRNNRPALRHAHNF